MGHELNNKELNESLILNEIRKHSPISRTDIAKVTGLSGATVTKFVDKLFQMGFVREDSYDVSKGGRRPILSLIPVLIPFFIAQKYYIQGIVLISVKG